MPMCRRCRVWPGAPLESKNKGFLVGVAPGRWLSNHGKPATAKKKSSTCKIKKSMVGCVAPHRRFRCEPLLLFLLSFVSIFIIIIIIIIVIVLNPLVWGWVCYRPAQARFLFFFFFLLESN